MSEKVSYANTSFVNRYTQEYPPAIEYFITSDGEFVLGTSSREFRSARTDLLCKLLEGIPKQREMSQALAAEEIVSIALKPLVERQGFFSCLAPQNLECGYGHKGVDLIITDEDNMSYLGIDVKLRTGRSPLDRDGAGWSERLLSPYIYLSLGNWSVSTREEDGVNIRNWLSNYALPKIPGSGKIPKLNDFRRYLVNRIERSLHGMMEKINEPKPDKPNYCLPEDESELEILKEKLPVMCLLFSDIKLSLN